MGNTEGLSKDELKDLILKRFRSLGVDTDLIRVRIGKGPKVILRGEVYSDSERMMIIQSVIDDAGVEDIVDELVIMRGIFDDDIDDDERERGLYDDDDDYLGTEDVFRSIEDGIPYIPPTRPSYHEEEEKKWKKKKKK